MKPKALILISSFAGIYSASAFSLDFSGFATDGSDNLGSQLGEELVVNVPGFGDVAFGVQQSGATAVISEIDGEPAIQFDPTRSITIDFSDGGTVQNVVVSFVGIDAGENTSITIPNDSSALVALSAGTAGISEVTFDRVDKKIPEPSTAVLGLLGAVALLRRRR